MVTDHKRYDMAVSFLAVFLPNIFQTGIPEWVSMPFSSEISTQGSNLGLLHCRQILYCLSHQGSQFLARVALFMTMIEAYKAIQAHKC